MLGESQGTTDGTVTLLERFNPDGTPDVGFGTGGLVKLQLSTLSTITERKTIDGSLALNPDGSVIVGVSVSYVSAGPDDDRYDRAIVRLTSSGTIDPTFGTGGVERMAVGDSYFLADLVRAPDGRIVIAGTSTTSAGRQAVIVNRFLPNGTPDPSFAFAHQFATGTRDSYATAVAVAANGAVVFGGGVDTTSGPNTIVGRIVGNTAPIPAIAPVVGATEEAPIQLDASGSKDDGDIASYSWDLNGDGTFGDATGAKTVGAFPPGPRVISVQVTDTYGLSATAKQTFTVLAEPGVVTLPAVASVKGTTASLTIMCRPGPPCNGSLALSSMAGAHAQAAKSHRATSYGSTGYAIAASTHKVVKVRLTGAGQTALRRRGSLNVWLAAKTSAAGGVLNAHRTLALHNHNRIPRRHKKHSKHQKHQKH